MSQTIAAFGQITDQGFVPADAESAPHDQTRARTVLSQFALLQIDGPDSEKFLQGQLTCDMKSVTFEQWQAGACCDAKGRMIANFIATRSETGFVLRLPSSQQEVLMNHLKKYAVFFKATMTLAENIEIIGEFNASPSEKSMSGDDIRVLGWPDGRCEYWVPEALIDEYLSDHLLEPESRWHTTDVESGWLWVQPLSSAAWIPQYCDWQAHDGISFSKGCYTGQEVVARLQYLGKSKRHLYQVAPCPELPEIMSDVLVNGKAKGELASRVCFDGKCTGLAVVSSDEETLAGECGNQKITLRRVFYTEDQRG
jgi:folate-binding protein YgfZ